MDENKIWQKIARELADEISNEDKLAIDDWCNESSQNKTTFTILGMLWNYNPVQKTDTTAIYRKFRQRQDLYDKRESILSQFKYYALRISAVLLLLISLSFLINEYLITGRNEETAYQEIFIPKGNRTSFILPDGTKVWLSNNSTIKYPHEFSKKTRELELSGEAYFEVTPEKKRQFIVNIGQNRVRVLGTRFSVTAYPGENSVQTELISGRVVLDVFTDTGKDSYKSYEIKPSHGLILDKSTGKLFETEIPEGFYNYWQNGVYEFNNESLESLAKKINRIFNVELVFEDENIKTRRFSGTIDINDNIFTFLEAIKRTSIVPFDYKYTDGKIYVKPIK
jgi:transmembrane sensor